LKIDVKPLIDIDGLLGGWSIGVPRAIVFLHVDSGHEARRDIDIQVIPRGGTERCDASRQYCSGEPQRFAVQATP
jgi:hypothetical protein